MTSFLPPTGLGFSAGLTVVVVVVYLLGRQYARRRTARCEALTEDVIGRLREGQIGRADSVLHEAGGGFAREIHRILAEGAVDRCPTAPSQGEDLSSSVMPWRWTLRILTIVAVWTMLPALDRLSSWWFRPPSRYGPSTWSQALPIFLEIVAAALPGVLPLVFLRKLNDLEWWEETRRAELLLEIRRESERATGKGAA